MPTPTVAPGLCECGCGEATEPHPRTNRAQGAIKGQPKRFVFGHQHHVRIPLGDHFMRQVVWNGDPDECWDWAGSKSDTGYGRFSPRRGRAMMAHRFSYEYFTGRSIPDGFHIDHLCRNPSCVNPDHLEAVTPRENTMRGVGPSAKNAVKTHCKNGHEFTPENTRTWKGVRACRTCQREATARYLAKQKEKQC